MCDCSLNLVQMTVCQPTPCVPCVPCSPCMNDCLARQIECIWKGLFCDATIIPTLGMPSCNGGVMVLTHQLGNCIPNQKINGLCVKSMLANNAYYSAEVSDCKWVNLYQALIPNVAGKCGCKSSNDVYTEALVKWGISIDSSELVWTGSCPGLLRVTSKAIGMDPSDFSRKQVAALRAVLCNYPL